MSDDNRLVTCQEVLRRWSHHAEGGGHSPDGHADWTERHRFQVQTCKTLVKKKKSYITRSYKNTFLLFSKKIFMDQMLKMSTVITNVSSIMMTYEKRLIGEGGGILSCNTKSDH